MCPRKFQILWVDTKNWHLATAEEALQRKGTVETPIYVPYISYRIFSRRKYDRKPIQIINGNYANSVCC